MNKLMTVSEVAKLLRVNRNFVYRLINDGELEAVNEILTEWEEKK